MDNNNIFDKITGNNNYTLETETLNIKDNAIMMKDSSFQITNISSIERNEFKNPITLKDIIILLIFIVISRFLPIVGLLGLSIYGFFIYQSYQKHLKRKYFISFNLNSNRYYTLFFNDRAFRDEVYNITIKSFNNQHQNISIDIKNQKIENQTVYEKEVLQTNILGNDNVVGNEFGENNVIAIKGDATQGTTVIKDSVVENIDFETLPWSDMKHDLELILSENTDTLSDDLKATFEKLLESSTKHQQEDFKQTVKENKNLLSKPFVQNLLSGTLANIISSILTQ